VLLLIGFGSTIGVVCGGRIADWKPVPALSAMMILQAAIMGSIYFASPYPLPMIVLLVLWGGLNFSIGTAVQTRILAWTADAPNMAASLIPSGFNIGIALAASIGAQLLDGGYGYRSLPLLGLVSMLVGTLAALLSRAAERRSAKLPPLVKPLPPAPAPPDY
jgi:DHA1 family inner membrane transport protein